MCHLILDKTYKSVLDFQLTEFAFYFVNVIVEFRLYLIFSLLIMDSSHLRKKYF